MISQDAQARALAEQFADEYVMEEAIEAIEKALQSARAEEREACAKIADKNTYMNPEASEGGHFGGPGSCEYGCGEVIAAALRQAGGTT